MSHKHAVEMKRDWDERALLSHSDAIVGQQTSEDEFWASGQRDFNGLIWPLVEDLLPPEKRRAALEIGCGAGRLLLPLSQKFNEVTGVDVSSEMIRLADDATNDFPNIRVLTSDGLGLTGIPDCSISFVFSRLVFQHMPTRQIAEANLAEIARVLEPGGVFLIDMPIAGGWKKLLGLPVYPRRLLPQTPRMLKLLWLWLKRVPERKRRKTWYGYGGHAESSLRKLLDSLGLEVTNSGGTGSNRGKSKQIFSGVWKP